MKGKGQRNILFITKAAREPEEYQEFASGLNSEAFFAFSTSDAIRILNDHPIDKIVLMVSAIQDAGILKYINDYFPAIRVVIVANKEFDSLISIFNSTKYAIVHNPVSFKELRKELQETQEIIE